MGSSKSKFSALTEALLEEYSTLTYLNKAEILQWVEHHVVSTFIHIYFVSIYKVFSQIDRSGVLQRKNVNARFPSQYVEEVFTQLKVWHNFPFGFWYILIIIKLR